MTQKLEDSHSIVKKNVGRVKLVHDIVDCLRHPLSITCSASVTGLAKLVKFADLFGDRFEAKLEKRLGCEHKN